MKNYHIIAGIFSLCLMLTGCDNSAESEINSEATASIAETQAQADDELDAARKELEEMGYTPEEIADMLGEPDSEATSAGTEEETINPELFSYYDLLNEEYEKYGCDSGFYTLNGMRNAGWGVAEIAYNFVVVNPHLLTSFDSENIYTYDTTTKEFKVLFPCDGSYYYNHGFYYRRQEADGILHIEKMDMEGNIIATGDISHADANLSDESHDMYFNFITENGFIITNYSYSSFGDTVLEDFRMISPDLQTVTALPQKAGEHGIMEDVKNPQFIASYQNKVYSALGTYLDTDTMTWNDLDTSLTGFRGCIGKYLILRSDNITQIYDMEKDEIIATASTASYTRDFARTCSGKYNYILKDSQWYRVQYPSDGSSVDFSTAEPLGTETASEDDCTVLDDTYYLVKDNYGIFLRTFEKGETEEETVLVFPDNELYAR